MKYIHIGYPKNFSTSLQRDYFPKHPELYHLGVGVGNNLGYRDGEVEKMLEVYLKSCKYFKYKEVEQSLKKHLSSLLKSSQDKYEGVGISAEHLSFAFTHDGISAYEKAQRLHYLFGEDTKIIIIVRNQFSLIKSLYSECVRVGFGDNFSNFLKLLYKYQDRNFIYDFRYDYLYDTYCKLFGDKNVGVFFFEDYRTESRGLVTENNLPKLYKDLNRFLKISDYPMEFGHYNEALPSSKILYKASLNKREPYDLGNHLLESAEKHRIKKYLEEDLGFYEEEKITYSDVLIKRKLIKETLESDKEKTLNFTANHDITVKLKSFYKSGNQNFSEMLNKDIPSEYFDLNF